MVIVYTDGSATSKFDINRNRSGGIGIYFEQYPHLNFSKSYKNPNVTNQQMEIKACIKAIKIYSRNFINDELKIYTDSIYVINLMTKFAHEWKSYDWKRKSGKIIKNIGLIKKLYDLTILYKVCYIKIKSHSPEPTNKDIWDMWYGNKQADKLALTACRI